MKCCVNCFEDKELRDIISTLPADIGECDYCYTKNTQLANPVELADNFMQLSQSYEVVKDDSSNVTNLYTFFEKIQYDWKIFSEKIEESQRSKLVESILADLAEKDDPLLHNPVEQKVILRGLESTQPIKKWEDFTNEIKRNNRYFIGKEIDLELLETLFAFYSDSYNKGKFFYRARISDKKGHDLSKMGKPPRSETTSGRANPAGIPYLYISTDKKTVLSECRASYLDYVTIAEFQLKENLEFVSLRKTKNISPFAIGDGLDEYLKHRKYLKKIESELSKPMRRQDRKIDYLPTQYLCEFIKSLGYDAIEYGSALEDDGINLAVFKDGKLRPIKTEVHEVISMDLQTKVV